MRAASAPSATWRDLHQWPTSDSLTGVAATGPRHAWTIVQHGAAFDLQSLNGSRSSTVTALPQNLVPEVIAASSATNIWIFGTDSDTPGTTATASWNGSAWQQGELPPGTGSGSAAVISPSGVWYAYGSKLWKLSGSTWFAQPAETAADVAAGPGAQAWQVGRGKVGSHSSALIARRWTGTAWQWVRLPHPVAKGSPEVSVGSARNVWILVQVAGHDHYRLLHWNGHRWRTITVPVYAAEAASFVSVTAVGSDSAWFSGDALWDGQRWLTPSAPLYTLPNQPPAGVPGTDAATAAIGYRVWINGKL